MNYYHKLKINSSIQEEYFKSIAKEFNVTGKVLYVSKSKNKIVLNDPPEHLQYFHKVFKFSSEDKNVILFIRHITNKYQKMISLLYNCLNVE